MVDNRLFSDLDKLLKNEKTDFTIKYQSLKKFTDINKKINLKVELVDYFKKLSFYNYLIGDEILNIYYVDNKRFPFSIGSNIIGGDIGRVNSYTLLKNFLTMFQDLNENHDDYSEFDRGINLLD